MPFPTLDALLKSGHQVVGVVTQPDRPRGRGQKITAAPVKARAGEDHLRVLQPPRPQDPAFLPLLAALDADLGVVAAYGRILSKSLLATPRLGMINVHASLLPKYRGAAPIHRAVIAGERETGVTIMRLVKALDAGPMLAHASRPIDPDETSVDVEGDLARIGAELLALTVDRLTADNIIEIPQDDSAATYAPRLTKEEGLIDWSQPALAIHNLVRGLHPWPHAYSFVNGHRLIVLRSSLPADQTSEAPGTIVAAQGDLLRVATGTGALDLREIQIEGKRPTTPRELLAGRHLMAGDRLTTGP